LCVCVCWRKFSSSRMSFSSRPTLDPLVREQREIERRRLRNEDRRLRILNAKSRIIGVDTGALEKQIREKQALLEQEKLQLAEYGKQAIEAAQAALAVEVEQRRQARDKETQLAQERVLQAAIKHAKESTLDCASKELERKQSSAPLLKFLGEDDDSQSRVKSQKKQQSEWIAQQVLERKQREEEEKQRKSREDARLIEAGRLATEAEQLVQMQRARDRAEVQRYNFEQAEVKKQKKQLEKEMESELASKEIQTVLSSTLMTESLEATRRSDNPNRHIPYNFKGFSEEKRREILEDQLKQIQEKQLRQQQEKRAQQEYESQQEEIRKQLLRLQRLEAVRRAEAAARVRAVQQLQKREHEARYSFIEKTIYTNPVEESFFEQFGTSAR